MIALKAAIGFGGNEQALIEAAVANYQVELPERTAPCPTCGGPVDRAKVTVDYPKATVKNTPGYVCRNCGKALYPLTLLEVIEEELDNRGLKGEVDFDALLQPAEEE